MFFSYFLFVIIKYNHVLQELFIQIQIFLHSLTNFSSNSNIFTLLDNFNKILFESKHFMRLFLFKFKYFYLNSNAFIFIDKTLNFNNFFWIQILLFEFKCLTRFRTLLCSLLNSYSNFTIFIFLTSLCSKLNILFNRWA